MENVMRYFSLVARKSIISFMVTLAVCGSANTFAAVSSDKISGAQMKQRINSFLAAQNLVGKPAISDKRLFPACESDVLVRPMFGGMKTVELFCPDPGGFKIAVRTNVVSDDSKRFLTGDANQVFDEDRLKSAAEKYLAMARSVQKGQILSHDDVVLREADAKTRTGYFVKVSDVVGRKVKQKLSVNQVILSRHLEIDWDIQKGQKIIIQSTAGPVVVVSSGISMGNAQIGELLEAQNQHSGKLIEGIVVSQKKIKVLTK
jgi:flagella basal body P-ring formation protein FlgA